jgi:hypothetical protein
MCFATGSQPESQYIVHYVVRARNTLVDINHGSTPYWAAQHHSTMNITSED